MVECGEDTFFAGHPCIHGQVLSRGCAECAAAGSDAEAYDVLSDSGKRSAYNQFGHGNETLARAIANNDGFSIAGGGDALAAVDKYGITEQVSYISTGGGAFLEFVEGKALPAVEILKQRVE